MEVVIFLMIHPVKYVLNKTKDVNPSGCTMITRINESKTLTKHISYKYKCRFDDRKYNAIQNWNSDKC